MNKEDVIFMDVEFAKLKPDGIDLLSIALVKPKGDELYLEIEFKGEIDGWVKENVLPYLKQEKISKEKASELIKEFVGDKKSYLISYVNQFDWMGICKLFTANNSKEMKNKIPFHWVPIDFGSMLFERGIEPGIPLKEIAKKYNIDISNIREHHALEDAKLLKKIYNKIIKET